jgi:hypothetical protein
MVVVGVMAFVAVVVGVLCRVNERGDVLRG